MERGAEMVELVELVLQDGGSLSELFDRDEAWASTFERVAGPGDYGLSTIAEGDLCVRRALGEGRLAHLAVVATGELHDLSEMPRAGLTPEGQRPGWYAQVVEGGAWPHARADRFARRVLDTEGRVCADTVILRARGARRRGAEAAEAVSYSAARFQGNARLLDALNGRGNIRKPLKDPAVGVIQQALVDLGYELPRHGVDSDFGSETKAAVRLFQREQKRRDPSFGVDGVVGPETMGRLDAIFVILDRPCAAPTPASSDPSSLTLAQPSTIPYSGGTVTVNGTPIEVRGTIFYPAQSAGSRQTYSSQVAAQGPAPIVFIAHGNHATFHNPATRNDEDCTQHSGWLRIANHDGYPYFQEMLAKLGIISVSVDGHETNCKGLSATNIRLRSGVIIESIRHLMTLHVAGSGSPIEGQVDFGRSGLLGHSRGGEAVVAVPSDLAAAGAPVNAAQIRGIISLAPTEVGTVALMPTGIPFMAVLPAGDGDVVPNDGAKLYDRFSPAPFKCQLYIHRTNHNRFNREWPVDDGRAGAAPISRAEHERLLEVYGAAFFRQAIFGEDFRALLSGEQVVTGVRNDQVVISHEIDGFTTVDDHERIPPLPARPIDTNTLGGATSQAGTLVATENALSFSIPPISPAGNYPGDTRGMIARSPTAYGVFRSALAAPVDLGSSNRELWIRAAESYDGTSIPAAATRFQIGVEDARGRIAFVSSGDLARPFDRRTEDLARFGADLTKTVFQTIRIPIRCFTLARPGVDMTRIRALVIRMHGPAGRRIVFDTLQISPP